MNFENFIIKKNLQILAWGNFFLPSTRKVSKLWEEEFWKVCSIKNKQMKFVNKDDRLQNANNGNLSARSLCTQHTVCSDQ